MELTEVPAYIQEHLGEDILLTDLAKKCFMSPSAFKSHFKRMYGDSVGQYIIKRKMYKAADMLTSGKVKSVMHVGYTLGYSNLSNFSKAFKQVFGHLPSEAHIKEDKYPPLNEADRHKDVSLLTVRMADCPEYLKLLFEDHFGIPIIKILNPNLAHAV